MACAGCVRIRLAHQNVPVTACAAVPAGFALHELQIAARQQVRPHKMPLSNSKQSQGAAKTAMNPAVPRRMFQIFCESSFGVEGCGHE
jgi:hypothetical protein